MPTPGCLVLPLGPHARRGAGAGPRRVRTHAGFTIRHVEEWRSTDAQIAAQPKLAVERERPMLLLLLLLLLLAVQLTDARVIPTGCPPP